MPSLGHESEVSNNKDFLTRSVGGYNLIFNRDRDGEYLVPPLNCDKAETIDPSEQLFYVVDDKETLKARSERMIRSDAYAESPRSNIRHTISNVSILEASETDVRVTNNLVVYRFRRQELSTSVAVVYFDLRRDGDQFMIRRKRVCLDNDSLKPQGSLAIIL